MYILITAKGKVMQFSVLACAEVYVAAYGGTIISNPLYAEVYAEVFEAQKN
jgi:hypothetical protein